jgi:hypothetical protein
MQRPKTGFKQKNDEDLLYKTNIDMIEKYTDLLYEDKYEDKVKGARSLLVLIADPENIYKLITEKETQIDIISRTLKDEHKKSMELLINILGFFYNFSFYEEFHSLLLTHSIGETCMNLIEFQYAKYVIRKNEIMKKEAIAKTNPKEYQKELDKFLFLVRKQDRILRLAFTILMHLAEDPKVEFKMVKKDIVGFLVKNIDRNNINLIVVILLFLKKLSIYDVNKDAMVRSNIVEEFFK